MEDLFGTASGKPQEETSYPELPLKLWFAARTSDRGGAVPRIIEGKTGPFMFKTGLFCIGGDGKKVTERLFGSYAFFEAFLRPNYKDQEGPQSQADFDTLSGRLVGFINTLLSPGIEDKAARWDNSRKVLGAYAGKLNESTDPEVHLSPDMFAAVNGKGEERQDNAHYMARVFTLLLRDQQANVIVNLKVDTGKDGDRNDIVVQSYKDATVKNSKTTNGQLTMFTSREGDTYDFYGADDSPGEDVTAF